MRTLNDLLTALFPYGTAFPEVAQLERQDGTGEVNRYAAPSWPPDAFAFAAKLLDLSGAYHHVAPETRGAASGVGVRKVSVSEADRGIAVAAGRTWSTALRRKFGSSGPRVPDAPAAVSQLWKRLMAAGAEKVFVELDIKAEPPAWWRDALMLCMIADEASADIGFDPDTRGLADPANALEMFMDIIRFTTPSELGREGADNFYSCSFANQNLLGVMPKARTPAVGCTVRSLSHNLALMPPGGEVRVRWLSPHEVDATRDKRPLKILIVPFPYTVEADCFEPVDVAEVDAAVTPWGWFHIVPRWLGPAERSEQVRRAGEFADFVVNLVDGAGRSGEPVGAVMLPEAALNDIFFRTLFDALLRRCPSVETLVSGVSEMRLDDGKAIRQGNFVAQGVFVTSKGQRQGVLTIREKHHRWRVERSQIETYGLGSRLNPATLWWESIDITSRSLSIVAFRPNATMTTLICEDLARVDPCQAAVRAIGPSLLVALLMDGSQLSFRWPSRYATVLAEDPGCSVLTISSLGLINRSRLPDGSRPKWSVALWRDDQSGPAEIVMDPGHQGVCITVEPQWRTECTLDGRQDQGQALAWSLRPGAEGRTSVRATGDQPSWIVDGTS